MTQNLLSNKIITFFKNPFFRKRNYIISFWIVLTLVSVLKQLFIGKYNNYKIFRQVYYHLIEKLPLYSEYPQEYFDHNHYGPIFSLIIAPFAVMPDYLGMPLWGIFNAVVLIYAIIQLPLKKQQINAVLWICLHEYLTTLLGLQFNPLMTAILLLAFTYIHKEKDFWAALFITIGVFVKLYGIVGLAFFFFSRHKIKFILSLLFWSAVLFTLPMLISSPDYIVYTYQEWYERLVIKNNENVSLDSMQDISLMGMVRRICKDPTISNIPFLLGGIVLFGLQYLRISLFTNTVYRLYILASTLIFTVIFSTGSESPTYIIAFTGVAIWLVIQPKPISNWQIGLFIFAFILTSLSPTDLIPKFLKENYIRPYALKALPCVLIWIVIVYQIYTKKFEQKTNE